MDRIGNVKITVGDRTFKVRMDLDRIMAIEDALDGGIMAVLANSADGRPAFSMRQTVQMLRAAIGDQTDEVDSLLASGGVMAALHAVSPLVQALVYGAKNPESESDASDPEDDAGNVSAR